MSARTALRDALTAGLPDGWRVIGSARPARITRPTVMLWESYLEPLEQTNRTHLTSTLDLWVLVPDQNPDTADDALDAALVDVLAVLHPLHTFAWTAGERGVLDENTNGWKLTVTAAYRIGD